MIASRERILAPVIASKEGNSVQARPANDRSQEKQHRNTPRPLAAASTGRKREPEIAMSLAPAPNTIPTLSARDARQPTDLTLLELVQAVADVTEDDREIVATVLYMLRSGHVRLSGNFRDAPIEMFSDEAILTELV